MKFYLIKDHYENIAQFYYYLRHEALAPRSNTFCPDFTIEYGRFPLERRYNMDQVPLPFVVNQESTYTVDSDVNVHIKDPSEALRKRQFTMHLFVNAGEGEKRDGCTCLICKGAIIGWRKTIEKTAWNKKVKVLFQKNAWVDTGVMILIAKYFVAHVRSIHGVGLMS